MVFIDLGRPDRPLIIKGLEALNLPSVLANHVTAGSPNGHHQPYLFSPTGGKADGDPSAMDGRFVKFHLVVDGFRIEGVFRSWVLGSQSILRKPSKQQVGQQQKGCKPKESRGAWQIQQFAKSCGFHGA